MTQLSPSPHLLLQQAVRRAESERRLPPLRTDERALHLTGAPALDPDQPPPDERRAALPSLRGLSGCAEAESLAQRGRPAGVTA